MLGILLCMAEST